MKAIILCDQRQKDLFPVNELTPDSMLVFCGNSAAYLAVKEAEAAAKNRSLKICALSDFLPKQLKEHLDSISMQQNRIEVIEKKAALGRYIGELCDEEGILVIEAGCMSGLELDKMIDLYNEMSKRTAVCCAVCAVKSESDTEGYVIRSSDMIAESFTNEKYSDCGGEYGLFAGAAFLSYDMAQRYCDSELTSIGNIISAEINSGGTAAVYYSKGVSRRLLTPVGYRNAALKMLSLGIVHSDASEISEGIWCRDNISISGITLCPPVYIGEGVRLEKGSVIENCVIEDNAVVQARSELRGCVIGESARIGAGVRAAGAAVCAGADIRAAAQLNDGSVIGERACVANGSLVSDGVLIAAEKVCAAGDIISEDILTGGDGSAAMLDDDCACGFSNGVASPSECASFAAAIGASMKAGTIAVCGCSGEHGALSLLASFESGLSSAGIKVISAGECTAQELTFLVNRLGAQIGCYINAQFGERIELMGLGGLPLNEKTQSDIERCCSLKRRRSLPLSSFGERYDMQQAKALYGVFLSQLMPAVFKGVNADIRCSAEKIRTLADGLIRSKNDIDGERIIFHISNDGKTCTAYTDATGYVSGERLVLLGVKIQFEKDIPVALPFTYPMAADRLAENMGGKLYRYFHSCVDGSDHNAREVASRPDNFFVRDGIVLMCMICAYLSDNSFTLSQALSDLPEFYSAQRFAVTKGKISEIYSALGCRAEGGGEEIVMEHGQTRAMVRPLKHSKGIMIFTESLKAETASALCDDIIERLKKL